MSARIEKTVFISYRRVDWSLARNVFDHLAQHGYDVFMDSEGLGSGDFEAGIVDNIRSRAHFLVLLTPHALDRADDPDDWLRREVETALRCRRNIVSLLVDGFSFNDPANARRLHGSLEPLRRYNGLPVHREYFDEAMTRLRERYLSVPIEAVRHPAAVQATKPARRQRQATSGGTPIHAPTPRPQTTAGRSTGSPALGDVRFLLGLPADQAQLGLDYYNGENGQQQDDRRALECFRSAAASGNADGQAMLGLMFKAGRGGLPKDEAQAVEWFGQGAAQGHALAQNYLGFLAFAATDPKVRDAAQAWLRRSAPREPQQP